MNQSDRFYPSIFIGIFFPLFLWCLYSPWSAELDLKVSEAFFDGKGFSSHPFWDWVYIYGLFPGWCLAGLAVGGFLCSFRSPFKRFRAPCFYLILTLSIGSGLIIHGILKDHWGRPRPRQVTEFGGTQLFRPYYQGQTNIEPFKSFASGHASMGFYFFSLAMIGSVYRLRWLFWLGLSLSFTIGTLLSLARIAQGGHFLSDTLAAGLIMWLTAWIFAHIQLFSKLHLKKEK